MAFQKNAASNLVQQLNVKDTDIHRLEAEKACVQRGLEERSEKVRYDEGGGRFPTSCWLLWVCDHICRWNVLWNYRGWKLLMMTQNVPPRLHFCKRGSINSHPAWVSYIQEKSGGLLFNWCLCLAHAKDIIKKHQDGLQDMNREQLPVKLEEGEKIQGIKVRKRIIMMMIAKSLITVYTGWENSRWCMEGTSSTSIWIANCE